MDKAKELITKVTNKITSKAKSLTKPQKTVLGLAGAYILYKSFKSFLRKPKDIKGKVVFITGAGNGIGKALATRFARHGAKVVIADINEPLAQELANSLLSENLQALAIKCDVTDQESIQRAASITRTHFGHPTILINNAGIIHNSYLTDMSVELFEKVIKVNLISHFYAIKEFLPNMIEVNEGHVVNIASYAGHSPLIRCGAYCASKYGVVGLTEVLRHELRKLEKNVKTTVVCPIFVDTDIGKEAKPGVKKLSVDYVAEKILNGILYDEAEVFIPSFPRTLFSIKYLFSTQFRDNLAFALGTNDLLS